MMLSGGCQRLTERCAQRVRLQTSSTVQYRADLLVCSCWHLNSTGFVGRENLIRSAPGVTLPDVDPMEGSLSSLTRGILAFWALPLAIEFRDKLERYARAGLENSRCRAARRRVKPSANPRTSATALRLYHP